MNCGTLLLSLALCGWVQDDLGRHVERYIESPEDESAREALLDYGRKAVPLLLRARKEGRLKELDRGFLYRLKFAQEKRESNLHLKKKAEKTKLDLALEQVPLLQAAHAITTRAASHDH